MAGPPDFPGRSHSIRYRTVTGLTRSTIIPARNFRTPVPPGGEIPNIPYRWIDAVVQGLTYRLSRIYPPAGVDPIAFRQECKAEADEAWKVAAEQDTEGVPLSCYSCIGRILQ